MKKAIVLKSNQRKLTQAQRKQLGIQSQSQPSPEWQPHTQDVALDAWGIAIRALKQQDRI